MGFNWFVWMHHGWWVDFRLATLWPRCLRRWRKRCYQAVTKLLATRNKEISSLVKLPSAIFCLMSNIALLHFCWYCGIDMAEGVYSYPAAKRLVISFFGTAIMPLGFWTFCWKFATKSSFFWSVVSTLCVWSCWAALVHMCIEPVFSFEPGYLRRKTAQKRSIVSQIPCFFRGKFCFECK